jgi:uncharacterized protein YecT (DUF1311 family)
MKIMITVMVIALGLLLLPSTAVHSASFDCNKASNYAEGEICAYEKISNLDDKLATLYNKVKKTEGNWREGQLAWLKERNQCKTTQCVSLAYQSRVLFFESVVANETKQHFELIEATADAEYCAGLLEFTNTKYANSSGLLSEQLPWQPLKPKKVKHLNGRVGGFYTGETYLEIDVNGDKKIDTIMKRVTSIHSRHFHYIHILDNKRIHDLDFIDMEDLKKEWMIDYSGRKKYSWSLLTKDSIFLGWLDVISYRGVPIFVYLDNFSETNQQLLYFNIDPNNLRSSSSSTVVGISPLCLLSAKNGFETKYYK